MSERDGMTRARGKRRWPWLAGLALAAVAVAVAAKWNLFARDPGGDRAASASTATAPSEAQPPRVAAVEVAPIQVRKVQRKVGVVGTFAGFDEVTVMAEVTGRVAKTYHEAGDVVRPGDVLLEIDSTYHELAFEETKRALELEASRVGLPIPPPEQFNPEAILAILNSPQFDIQKLPTVVKAREQEDLAKSRFERSQSLRQSNTISQEEFDQRATEYQVALTNRVQAVMDGQSVVAGIKHRLVLLRTAERKLRDTKVVVPTPTRREGMPESIEYAVAERKVAEGEMLKDAQGSSTATFELVMDGVLKLLADVPERYAGQVQAGQAAEVRVESMPDRVFPGKVIRTSPVVDRASRTFKAEIRVENDQRLLKAGGFAKVDLLTRVDADAWTVPIEAVSTFAGSIKVFVVRDGKAHAVPVARGVEGRDSASGDRGLRGVWVELVRGPDSDLRPDDRVVVTGLEKLAEGVQVKPRTAGEKADEPVKP